MNQEAKKTLSKFGPNKPSEEEEKKQDDKKDLKKGK